MIRWRCLQMVREGGSFLHLHATSTKAKNRRAQLVAWSVLVEPAGALTDRCTCTSTTDLQEKHRSAMIIQHRDGLRQYLPAPTNQPDHQAHQPPRRLTRPTHTQNTRTPPRHQNPTQPQTKHQTTQQNPTPTTKPTTTKPKNIGTRVRISREEGGEKGERKEEERGKGKGREEERKEKYQHTGSNRGLHRDLYLVV